MNFKTFIIGLLVAFTVPWVAVIAVPSIKMANLKAIEFDEEIDGRTGVYEFTRSGSTNGAPVYAANGCAACHTQLVRPTSAGSDMYRELWAGVPADLANGIEDSQRETNAYDFAGEKIAQIGEQRVGPDLSNFAIRAEKQAGEQGITPRQFVLNHLFSPQEEEYKSVCSPLPFMFDGASTRPKSNAKSLADYLLSMRKDSPIPSSVNPRR